MGAPDHLTWALGPNVMDRLMPMHMIIGPDGRIRHAGPTLVRAMPQVQMVGAQMFDLFTLRRPRSVTSYEALVERLECPLKLAPLGQPDQVFKGVALPLPERGAMIVNLGFGIGVVEAVRRLHLTSEDFAPTDPTDELLFLIESNAAVLSESRDLTRRLQAARVAAEEQAFTDTLTGLKNRRALDHVLARRLRDQQEFALMHLDLDYFKDVNDTLGHAAGDHVLQSVARCLVRETRAEDTVARVGGDEFVIIINRISNTAQLGRAADRIIARLEEPVQFKGTPCRISGSIGITLSSYYASPNAERMFADADRSLYAAKHAGRAQHRVFDPTQAPSGAAPAPARPVA